MPLLRKIAFPIALLYGLVIHVRNILYDWGWLSGTSFETPVISIGNLSLGGTGKTPMIEWLLYALKDQYNLAVLSRGYGRKTKGLLEARPESTSRDIGDEPRQIFTKFPDVTLVVDANRRRGIRWLEKNKRPDIIILDDAHQHRKVRPSHAVLLTSYNNLYTRDWFFPSGQLRDSRSQAGRADCIIVTKCPSSLSTSEQELLVREVRAKPDQPVFFTTLSYDQQLAGASGKTLADLKDAPFTLLTGIADPEPLTQFLTQEGCTYEHLKYPDHYDFSEKEIQHFRTYDRLVITEKDHARLGNSLPNAWCIRMRHRFLGNSGNMFLESLGIRKQSASS